MAQALSDILSELDAGYAPSKQLINQQIDALPDQEASQQAGLDATQQQAFTGITNSARDKGIGFSGIPISEQATYTGGTYLPAVANLKTSINNQKTSLLGALNSTNQDELNAALGQQNTEAAQDFQTQQAAAANAAANASSAQLASLFGGTASTAPTAADPYAAVDKNNANTAVKSLLATNNTGTISKTIQAISSSANNGNLYDKYKLELLQSLAGNSQYGPLLTKAFQTPIASTY